MLEIDDTEQYRCVFPLFAAVCRSHADLFLRRIVRPERLCEMVADALEEGSFAVKRAALALVRELIADNSPLFTGHLVREKRIFQTGVDVLESAMPLLQRDYLEVIDRLLRSVAHQSALGAALVKRIGKAELRRPIEALFWNEDPDIGNLARSACVRLTDCQVQCESFPQFPHRRPRSIHSE